MVFHWYEEWWQFTELKDIVIYICIPLRWYQDPSPRLHYCTIDYWLPLVFASLLLRQFELYLLIREIHGRQSVSYKKTDRGLKGFCAQKPHRVLLGLSFLEDYIYPRASQVAPVVKNLPANAHKRCGFEPWVGKIPLRRKWQSTPVFLPRESHGQRSLAGYSP